LFTDNLAIVSKIGDRFDLAALATALIDHVIHSVRSSYCGSSIGIATAEGDPGIQGQSSSMEMDSP
jgi:hypothetical protein